MSLDRTLSLQHTGWEQFHYIVSVQTVLVTTAMWLLAAQFKTVEPVVLL